ncbi:hypothetical protein CEXT_442091 [Caerostris extrusa]|uniref:Uncharacterized protein n=1 Tax=Caerostris extrusa TaxID=172846 RepID=A0AAV4XWL5_CAEEX|nr:hypothetical protein CEXT_442091 [Caerostris extrusa]
MSLVAHSGELTLLQDYSAHVTLESHCCPAVMDVCLCAKTVIFRCPGYYRGARGRLLVFICAPRLLFSDVQVITGRQGSSSGVSQLRLKLHSDRDKFVGEKE